MPNTASASSSTSTNPADTVSTRDGCNVGQILRETVTALLALGIAFVALWLLWDVHSALTMGKTDNYAQHKEVLLLALGLLGTVTGYYFGRVPAERHADAARDAAKAAQKREQDVRSKVHMEAAHIRRKHNETQGATPADEVNAALDRLSRV